MCNIVGNVRTSLKKKVRNSAVKCAIKALNWFQAVPKWTAWIGNESLFGWGASNYDLWYPEMQTKGNQLCMACYYFVKAGPEFFYYLIAFFQENKVSFPTIFHWDRCRKTLNCSSEHVFLASPPIWISGCDHMVIKLCPGHVFGWF